MPRPAEDLTGRAFGRWLVVRRLDREDTTGAYLWLCRCGCGTVRPVKRRLLVEGRSLACRSCSQREVYRTSETHRRHQRRLTQHVHAKVCPTCGGTFDGTARQVYCCPGHRR